MAVTLPWHLFAPRQDRLHVAHGHMHVRGVLRVLLHHAGDQLAALARERAEDLVVLGLAEQLLDHLARGRRGQAPEVVQGVVILLAELRRGVRIVFGGLLRDLVLRPDGECAGTRVQFDARVLRCMRCFQIRETQCFRQRLVHGFGIDFLLASELVNAVQVQFHDVDLLF